MDDNRRDQFNLLQSNANAGTKSDRPYRRAETQCKMGGRRRGMDSQGETVGFGGKKLRSGRVAEVQDPLNRLVFHPLAWRLACRLASTKITPNMVSFAGGALVVAAAIAYRQPGWPWMALLGFALHLTWHVVDGADGDLARLTKRSGPMGEIIDGLCDYASHIVLYITLGFVLQAQIGPIAWLFTLGAGFSRIIQANHYEVQRRQYMAWVHGVEWLRSGSRASTSAPWLQALVIPYLALANRLAPYAVRIDQAFIASRGDPGRAHRVQASIRRHSGKLLRESTVLSANWRTVTLGCSMLAGSPLYFFLFEAILLNAVLLRSLHNAAISGRSIVGEIESSAPGQYPAIDFEIGRRK